MNQQDRSHLGTKKEWTRLPKVRKFYSLTYFGICYKAVQCHFLAIIMSDFGLLDCIIQDVNQDVVISSPPMTETELEFNDILSESSESSNDMQNDILSASIQQSGINATTQEINRLGSWDSETDALLDSILTGSGDEKLAFDEGPLSDTSSDSGIIEQQLLSPSVDGSVSPHSTSNIDLIEYINETDEDTPMQAVNPVTNSPDPVELSSLPTGTTTIILPVITSNTNKKSCSSSSSTRHAPPVKRRRTSASSNDSGLDDFTPSHSGSQYPALKLTEEEKRLCEREGIRLPSNYPLTREEEKNLKKIRRKIRNKVSAQDSRKRKKEYIDAMEERVRSCTEENDSLHKKIELLETQNKTLASQLRRLHQIIVNGGLKQNQTSTAMMVLLLSTALFLIPGMREQSESKQQTEIDISQAIKVPPMPGQSRSLLQFPQIKQEIADEVVVPAAAVDEKHIIPHNDHDYFAHHKTEFYTNEAKFKNYIVDDVPPEGYGPSVEVKMEYEHNEDRELNVNVTSGGEGVMRTVVLHVPKDIK